jgi:hypothetical protein
MFAQGGNVRELVGRHIFVDVRNWCGLAGLAMSSKQQSYQLQPIRSRG